MKKAVILLLAGILSIPLVAQESFVTSRPLRRPVKYEKPNLETGQNTDTRRSNFVWEVWIDREGVTTSSGKRPGFLKKFYVVDERGDNVRLVKADESFDFISGTFMSEPEDFGWVEKSKLILWNTALYDTKTNFRLKILTITDPKLMTKRMEEIRDGAKMLAFYNSPVARTTNDNETPLFEVFYIYKKEGDRILLGNREEIGTGEAKYYIAGWVERDAVQEWGQRQTLEPNSEPAPARERRTNDVRVSIFADRNEAVSFMNYGGGSSAFWSDDKYEEGYTPYWKRLPILEKVEENIFETAVVSDLIQEDGEKIDVDAINNISQRFNEQRERSRKINVVFVVDGTRSMQPYIESIKRAVLRSATKLRDSENDFKFGAVIYRDYAQRDDDKCFEQHRLSNYSEFQRFMSTVDTDDPACYNSTVSEGMYKGLYKVRGLLRGKEKETNVVILVGDAGDRDGAGRFAENDVLPILKQYGISLLTIQTHHDRNNAYEDFIFQAKDLGEKSAREIVEVQKQAYGDLNLTSLNTRPRYVQDKDVGNRTYFTMERGPVGGALQYASSGQTITPEIVESEIEHIITDTDTKNDSLMNELNRLMSSVVVADPNAYGTFTPEAIQILIKAGFPAEDIQILMQKNYQFLLRGFTSLTTTDVSTPLYKFTLFMDQAELDELKMSLDKLYIVEQTSSARRDRFREAWLDVLRANYGAKREEVETRSLAELAELITGLPSPNEILSKYTLNDIEDVNVVSNSDFEKILNLIKEKRDLITRASGNKQYYFLSNDRSYYWIPQDMLP